MITVFTLTVDGRQVASFADLVSLTSGADPSTLVSTSGEKIVKTLLPSNRMPDSVVLRRGLSDSLELAAWHDLVLDGDVAGARKNATLTMYQSDGTPVARYHLENAWPSKIDSASLTSGGTSFVSETVTLVCDRIRASRSELPAWAGARPASAPRGRLASALSAIAVLLALASSATWGVADFCGGLLSRRLPAISVTVISQAAGFARCSSRSRSPAARSTAARSGSACSPAIGGGIGLAAFYKALSLGTMSIVSPVVACGAVVPFAISLATGERPSALALAGAAIALTGAVLASTEERRAPEPNRARAVAIAVVAAVALGLFTYFLGLGSREGSALSTLVGARIGSLTILLALAARDAVDALRVGRRWLLPSPRSASATSPRTRSSRSRAATACSRSSPCSARCTR